MPPRIALIGAADTAAPRSGQYASPPLGVHRLASYLAAERSAEVVVLDPQLLGVAETANEVAAMDPDLIGCSFLLPTLPETLRLVSAVRALHPQTPLIAGGQGVAGIEAKLVGCGAADLALRGLGEPALLACFDVLREVGRAGFLADDRLSRIPGTTTRSRGGTIISTPVAAVSPALFRAASSALDYSRIPYPRYWAINEARYSAAQLEIMRNAGLVRTIRINTQTHCPVGCNYCSSTHVLDLRPGQGHPVLMLEAGEVIEMIGRALVAHPATSSIYINDDDFLLSRARVLRFAEQARSRFDLAYIAQSRVDRVDAEIAQALAEVGFRLLFLGVETFSTSAARKMGKINGQCGDYGALAYDAVLELLRVGIVPQFAILPFHPAVGVDDLIFTIQLAAELVARGARLSVFPLTDAYPAASLTRDGGLYDQREVRYGTTTFSVPGQFLPQNAEMQRLYFAATSLHHCLRAGLSATALPQPLDGLLFFQAVLNCLGLDDRPVTEALAALEAEDEFSASRRLPGLAA